MKINEEQFKKILKDYLQSNYDEALNDVAFRQAIEFIELQLDDYLNLAAISTGSTDYAKERIVVHTLFNDSVVSNKFNLETATKTSSAIREQSSFTDLRDLHAQASNLGIAEKYLKGSIKGNEWLTDLDLQRMLNAMELKQKIKICPFKAEDIGMQLHFARKAKQENTFSIPLLLNKGSETGNQGSHWIAAMITVNPVTNSLTYTVEDSLSLTALQKDAIHRVIAEATNYEASLGETNDKWEVNQANSQVNSNETQKDSYSCGYRALHTLLNAPLLATNVKNNLVAEGYANCATISQDLASHAYELLLKDIRVESKQIQGLQKERLFQPSIKQKSKLQLNPLRVEKEVQGIFSINNTDSIILDLSLQRNALVDKRLQEFSAYETSIRFPGDENKTLTTEDYIEYFSEVAKKLKAIDRVLDTLIIAPCTVKSLNGLNAFPNQTVFFNTLTLDLGGIQADEKDVWIINLKKLLVNLSEKGLKNLTLRDNGKTISEKQWQEIASFIIEARNEITIDLLLPAAFQKTAIQCDIDQAVSSNQFYKIPVEKQVLDIPPTIPVAKKKIRTRAKVDLTKNVAVEIELQQQQQVEIAISHEKIRIGQDAERGIGALDVLKTENFEGFFGRLQRQKFNLPKENQLSDRQNAQEIWNTWFGHITKREGDLGSRSVFDLNGNMVSYEKIRDTRPQLINEYISGITHEACEHLLKYPKVFRMGLDFNHLPLGFALVEYPKGQGKQVLHYDKNSAVLQKTKDPLALVLQEQPNSTPLAYPLFKKTIEFLEKRGTASDKLLVDFWNKLNVVEYDRDAVRLFQQYLPKMMTYGKESMQLLFSLHLDANQFKKTPFGKYNLDSNQDPQLMPELLSQHPDLQKELNEWVTKIPTIKQDALLQLYSQCGEAGLRKLFSQWHETDLKTLQFLHESIFCHAKTYAPLLDESFQEAISAVQGFSGFKKDWWEALVTKQGLGVGYEDLPTLVQAFKAFSQAIEDKQLSFYALPSLCFQDVDNMPMALARMLTILDAVEDCDLRAQWENISELSFKSTGAIRALLGTEKGGERLSFVLPQMQVRSSEYGNRGYKPPEDWHELGRYYAVKDVHNHFYRTIASQKNRLPLPFYQEALKAIEARTFTDEIKHKLEALLVASTTGTNNSFHLGNTKESLEQLNKILDTLENLPLPFLFKAMEKSARELFVDRLFELSLPPSLPILVQLFSLITNSLKLENPVFGALDEFKAKTKTLDATCEILELATRSIFYGDAIYEGMRFYDHDDYKSTGNNSIFYSHIATAAKIMNYVKTNDAEDPSMDQINEPNKLLMRLISTFQIKAADVKDIAPSIQDCIKLVKRKMGEKNTVYALQLLTNLEKNEKNNQKLNTQDFISFLKDLPMFYDNTFKTSPETCIQNCIKKHFSEFYPADFFAKLSAVGISKNVELLIDAKFKSVNEKNQVKSILNRFIQPGESSSYNNVVQKISTLVDTMTLVEREHFLHTLQNDQLYSAGEAIETVKLVTFDALMDALLNRGQTNDLMYLLAQPNAFKSDGILEKTTLYLTTILPKIEKNPNDSVSRKDALDVAIPLLLKNSKDSLNTEFKLARPEHEDLDSLKELLTSAEKKINSVDLKSLEKTISEKNPENFQALSVLLEKLNDLNNPKPVEIKENQPTTSAIIKERIDNSINSARKGWGVFTAAIGSIFTPNEKPKTQALEIPKPVETKPEAKVKPFDAKSIQPYLKTALNELTTEIERRKTYAGVTQDLFKTVYQIADQYSGAKDLFIEFVTNYINNHKQTADLMNDTWNALHTLKQEFGSLNDEDMVRSLCYHYSATEGDRSPEALLKLINTLSNFELKPKHLLLRIVCVSLNNDKLFKTVEFQEFVTLCKDDTYGEQYLRQLEQFYKHAPYPAIQEVVAWHKDALLSDDYDKRLSDLYAAFDKKPCEREYANGFKLDVAKERAAQFSGINFLLEDLGGLNRHIQSAQTLSTAELLTAFKIFKERDEPDYPALVATAAELLYRSKGKEGGLGNSFEINTTQYLAILATLRSGSHNTSEIATGEGKSRIMAICNACQFGLGKSVDFVTSDMELATRDYLEFQSYFNLLGAKTNIIHADSLTSSYCIGGINYSDASNLQLFRNKACSNGKGDEVIDPNNKNRILLLDEADKTFFDVSERYNFSMQGDIKIKDMEWVYPLLIEFFETEANTDIYKDDIDGCNETFLHFANSKLDPEQVSKLKALPQAQLETWHDAAMQARALVFGKHFVIEPDTSIMTPMGPKIASEAKLLNEKDGRVSKSSKFSSGVHQCLHARLNRLKQFPGTATAKDALVLSKLKECKQPFNLDTEKQIIYSSTSKNLLDEYNEGGLIALTGTSGLLVEQSEASNLYGNMQFIAVPRHNGLKRVDRPVRLTANSTAQIDALVEYVQEARRSNQPVVIICENDKKSEKMFDSLIKALENKLPAGDGIQRIHSQLTPKEERDALQKAGKSGLVTVSTPMIGRGTDIKLHKDKEKNSGLKVLLTYLPRERDMKQVLGRSGRFGDEGDTRLVLNKKNVKKRLGKDSLNDGFYTAPETYLSQQQMQLDKVAQRDRLVANTINDFSKKLRNTFFEFKDKSPLSLHADLLSAWTKFTKDKDQLWDSEFKQDILGKMQEPTLNFAQINEKLGEYALKTQQLWDELYDKVNALNPDALTKKIDHLQLTEVTKSLVQEDLKRIEFKTPVYDKYDSAHDGRAVLYTRPFEKLRAVFTGERKPFADFRAWYNGHGILFPNLRALWNGHMSFGEFLFGTSSNSRADSLQTEPVNVGEMDSSVKEETFNSVSMQKKLMEGRKVGGIAEPVPLEAKTSVTNATNPLPVADEPSLDESGFKRKTM